MSAEKQREIASKGGRAAHEKGTAHEWSADEARTAGRKGGQVSRGGRGRLIVPSETAEPTPQEERDARPMKDERSTLEALNNGTTRSRGLGTGADCSSHRER